MNEPHALFSAGLFGLSDARNVFVKNTHFTL